MFHDSKLTAADVMTSSLATVHSDTNLQTAARMMVEFQVSGLPVVDDTGKVIGVISEADLIRTDEVADKRHDWWLHVLADGYQLAPEYLMAIDEVQRPVSSVMHHEVVSVAPTTSVKDVSKFMSTHNIKRVLVLDDGKLVGVVSRSDLLKAIATSKREL